MVSKPAKKVEKLKFAIYEKEGDIARIIYNRPEKLNAYNIMGVPEGVMTDMVNCLKDCEVDDDIKVVIIKGNGRCFSTGMDLADAGFTVGYKDGKGAEGTKKANQRLGLRLDSQKHMDSLEILSFPKITIAQVHSYCLGMATHIAAYCDFCVASEDAVFGLVYTRMFGDMASACALPFIHIVGLNRFREMALTGQTYSAQQMKEYGLVNKVVPNDRLEEEVEALAESLTLRPRDGLAIGKYSTRVVLGMLGITPTYAYWGGLWHRYLTNLKWEEGEYSFLRERRDKGLKSALYGMHDRFVDTPQATLPKTRKDLKKDEIKPYNYDLEAYQRKVKEAAAKERKKKLS
jgi:enoyl-CoA hydratase